MQNYFFDGVLKVQDENIRGGIRIWIWIRIHWSEARVRESGYLPNVRDPQHCCNHYY